MTELDAIEAKIDNFTQHFGAVGVTAGVPASRKCNHVKLWRQPAPEELLPVCPRSMPALSIAGERESE